MKDPFHFQWHITNLCNLHCEHCYQDDFSTKRDLDWSGLRKVSDNLLNTIKEWDQKACIHVTGGEPLLKPELLPLLDHLDQQSVVEELGIITNGLLVDREKMRRLSDFSKLKKIKISLDGADAETNDAIRSKGVFEKVMQNISLARKEKRFEIIVMFTVMKKNLRNLPSLFKLCQDSGINGLIIERFIPLGKGKGVMNEVLHKEEWKRNDRNAHPFFLNRRGRSFGPPLSSLSDQFFWRGARTIGGSLCHRSGRSLHHAGGKRFSLPKASHFNRESSGNSLETDMGRIRPIGEAEKKEEPQGKMWNLRDERMPRMPKLSFFFDGRFVWRRPPLLDPQGLIQNKPVVPAFPNIQSFFH